MRIFISSDDKSFEVDFSFTEGRYRGYAKSTAPLFNCLRWVNFIRLGGYYWHHGHDPTGKQRITKKTVILGETFPSERF